MVIPSPRAPQDPEWKEIEEFPGYSISYMGLVRNDRTGRFLATFMTQRGLVYVSFENNGRSYKRSLPLLVAEAFLEPPRNDAFDTPVNLNGDRTDNSMFNLVWRPLWFARRYNAQFSKRGEKNPEPIEEVRTGERFASSWDAAIKYGLLFTEVFTAAWNYTHNEAEDARVWPTGQKFKFITKTDIVPRQNRGL